MYLYISIWEFVYQVSLTKETVRLPSRHWHWCSEWQIDHDVPLGCDKDGWQYARNFRGSPFYARTKLRSYVRRRLWVRKCRIITAGPWKAVGQQILRYYYNFI